MWNTSLLGTLEGTELKMKIAPETLILGSICMLDMLSTVWLIHNGLAREGNPVMDFYVQRSLVVFAIVKSLLFVAPLTALELMRQKNPVFVRRVLRLGIAAYLLVYGVGSIRANSANADLMASTSGPESSQAQ